MKRTVQFALALLAGAWMAHADILIKQEVRTPAFMMQPAKTESSELWLGDGVMAQRGKESSVIINKKNNTMAMINHVDKSYVETSLPPDMSKLMPPEAAQAMSMMMQNMKVSVERTGSKKTVAGIDAVSYRVTMNMMGMPMVSTYWVAEEGLPFDWEKYQDLTSQFAQISMNGTEAMVKEFSKIQGFPLATEASVMGMTVVTETTAIDTTATSEADTYSVPAGYKKNYRLMGQ